MQSNVTEKEKTAIRVKKKANFFLLRETMILIHIHMEIKGIQWKWWLGVFFGFCRFGGNIWF